MPNPDFENKLARGLAFEQGDALTILHQRWPNSWITNNKVDPTESTNNEVVGPRAYRGEDRSESITLPDFQIMNEKGEFYWVDAKLKGAAYPDHNDNNRKYFTIDKRVNQHYRSLPKCMVDNLWLLFKHEVTCAVYITRFQIEPKMKFFNNRYGTGNVPIYYLDELIKLN